MEKEIEIDNHISSNFAIIQKNNVKAKRNIIETILEVKGFNNPENITENFKTF